MTLCILGIIVLFAAGVIILRCWRRQSSDAGTVIQLASYAQTEPPKDQQLALLAALRRNLRAKLVGDDRRVGWLLQAERNRSPHLSETEVVQAAIDRWEQDNRSWR